jgi:hypothetical protein
MDSAVLGLESSGGGCLSVRAFRQQFTFVYTIEFHAFAPIEALARV